MKVISKTHLLMHVFFMLVCINNHSPLFSQTKPSFIKEIEHNEQVKEDGIEKSKNVNILHSQGSGWDGARNFHQVGFSDSLKIDGKPAVKLAIREKKRDNQIFTVTLLDSAQEKAKYRIDESKTADILINIAKGSMIPEMKDYKTIKIGEGGTSEEVEKESVLEILSENLHAFMYSGSTTRAAFTVSGSGEGHIYLAKGDTNTIELYERKDKSGNLLKEPKLVTDFKMEKGDKVDFNKNGYSITRADELSILIAAAMNRFTKKYGQDIWKPFWQKPIFLGAFGGACGVLLIPKGKKNLPGPPPLPDN